LVIVFSNFIAALDAWVSSQAKESEGTQGKFILSAGKYYGDPKVDQGAKTTPDARFYQLSAKYPEFSNEGKDLIVQYSVKHEQSIDCGGAYIKLLPAGLDQTSFNGDSQYNIMFGPDICGVSTKKTHLIFNYKGKNHLIKKDIRAETDTWTHLYTLIVKPDNTYEVLIDSQSVAKGSLKEDFDMLPPKEIKDPASKKPADWVDEKTIADPEDKKPEGWDDIPAQIVDPDATKPSDWDDELDGEWEAPLIDNPDYKGEWRAKQIPNPAYKGEWVHPVIPNPEFVDDDKLYAYKSNNFAGFELWQVKSGTIFDNIIITDDIEEANKLAEVTKALQSAEKSSKTKQDDEEAKRREEESKSEDNEEEEDDEHEDHDHEGHDHHEHHDHTKEEL
jgi:calreticulin